MPVGPVINPAGLARIARYVGEAMVFESWEAVAEALCRMQGTQFPKADAAFWLRMARRAAREKDGRIVLDYDPAIAKALPPSGTAAPDLRPLFHSLMQSPILVVRGALSDILAAEGVAAMREMKPDLDYVQVSDVGMRPPSRNHRRAKLWQISCEEFPKVWRGRVIRVQRWKTLLPGGGFGIRRRW